MDLGHYVGISTATITVGDEAHREQLIAMAGRVAALASESLHLARRDIRASRAVGVSPTLRVG